METFKIPFLLQIVLNSLAYGSPFCVIKLSNVVRFLWLELIGIFGVVEYLNMATFRISFLLPIRAFLDQLLIAIRSLIIQCDHIHQNKTDCDHEPNSYTMYNLHQFPQPRTEYQLSLTLHRACYYIQTGHRERGKVGSSKSVAAAAHSVSVYVCVVGLCPSCKTEFTHCCTLATNSHEASI